MIQANEEHKTLSFLCCFDLSVCFVLMCFACSDHPDHMHVSHSLAEQYSFFPPVEDKAL